MNWSNFSTPLLCLLIVATIVRQGYCPCAAGSESRAQEPSSVSKPAPCHCGHVGSEGVGTGTTAGQDFERTPSPHSPAIPHPCECGRELSLLAWSGARTQTDRYSPVAWLPTDFTASPPLFVRPVECRPVLCRGVPSLTTDDILFAFHILRC